MTSSVVSARIKILGLFFVVCLFSLFSSAGPAYAEPITFNEKQAGLSVWLPGQPKPVSTSATAGMLNYMVKTDDSAYQIILRKKEASWPRDFNEDLLDQIIEGLKAGFKDSAEKQGSSSSFQFVAGAEGKGWNGKRFTGTLNKMPLSYLFGLSRDWFFSVTAVNTSKDDTEANKVFASLVFDNKGDSGAGSDNEGAAKPDQSQGSEKSDDSSASAEDGDLD
ncbi:MAG: hypothetical protein R3C24_09705 [Cyanobacteriota/Melainabacteria group bacterium]